MSIAKDTVAWIGLGAMGLGMATCLASQGFKVQAYDVYPPSLEKAVQGGCVAATSPAEAARGARVVGFMVVSIAQVDDILFGEAKVAEALSEGASVVVFSTCPPSALAAVQAKLDILNRGLGLVDSPVSGGSARAADGTLAIMVAGTSTALSTSEPMIQALTRAPGGLSAVGDKVGMASDFKLINQVYCAIQICVTGESMAFAKALGLNPRMTYNVIRTGDGDSFMFGHRVPSQWERNGIIKSAMPIIVKDVGIVMDEARLNSFPAPLCAVAEQVFTAAMGAGLGKEDDGNVIKLWERFGVPSSLDEGTEEEEIEKAKELIIEPGPNPKKVLYVGLTVTGAGMVANLCKAGLNLVAYDLSADRLRRCEENGVAVVKDLLAEAKEADLVVFANESMSEIESVLFGSTDAPGIAEVLSPGTTIILNTTVAPADAIKLDKSLSALNKDVHLVDAPISGGISRAAAGDFSVMASGDPKALSKAYPILSVLATSAGNKGNLHFIPGGVGSGSKMKAVDQLLAGIHICAAAEATNFARKKGMNLDAVFDVVSKGAASSNCMKDRGPRMRQVQAPVVSRTSTLINDLGIVLSAAKAVHCPLFLAAAAHQQFIRAASHGWAEADDSCVGRLWESMGVDIKDFQ